MRPDKLVIIGGYFLLLVIGLLMVSCQPYLTHDEMEEGAKTDPKIEKRLEKFERAADTAALFIERRAECKSDQSCHMNCTWSGIRRDAFKEDFKNVDELVKWFRDVKTSCGFADGDMW